MNLSMEKWMKKYLTAIIIHQIISKFKWLINNRYGTAEKFNWMKEMVDRSATKTIWSRGMNNFASRMCLWKIIIVKLRRIILKSQARRRRMATDSIESSCTRSTIRSIDCLNRKLKWEDTEKRAIRPLQANPIISTIHHNQVCRKKTLWHLH